MLASRLCYRCRTGLSNGRALVTGHVLREFLTTIIKNLWPAYLLASILILCGFWWSLPNAYQNKSFHFDEDIGVWAVQYISFPQFNPHVFNIGTGFFYQVYLIKLALTAGGLLHAGITETLLIGRSVVFASALGAITVLFLLGSKLFDAATGRLAALILAVLPGFAINSHYFKADVPLTLWILLTILVVYQFLDTGNPKLIFLLGLLVGYTTSVKPNGGVLLLVGFVVMVMRPPKAHKLLAWTSYLACVGIGFVVGEPLVLLPHVWPEIIRDLRHLRVVNRSGLIYHVARPPAWIDYALNVFPFSFTGPMLIASAVALVWVLVRWRTKSLPILTFLAAYYALLSIDNWRLVRYTVPILPFAALFLAAFVMAFRERRVAWRLAVTAVSALIIYAFTFSLSYVRVMAATDPRNQASRWIDEHVPKPQAIPEVYTFFLQVPQIELIGYKKVDVGVSIADLQKAKSPYLVVSEAATSEYFQAIEYYPNVKEFFQFIAANYSEVAHFENSQKLLFVDSKRGSKIPEDWLHPNPRITILIRNLQP